ncbi:MAG: hypothetical protein U0270_30180 [Labilithrix sp.]
MIRSSISIIAAMLAVGACATAPSESTTPSVEVETDLGLSACVPRTCAGLGVQCGTSADGCGGLLLCGTCSRSLTCVAGRCVRQSSCTPMTCAQLGAGCGPQSNGCGGLMSCGTCPAGQTCGGGGVPSQCGSPPTCTPMTCAQAGVTCGLMNDGCGGVRDCGPCPP